jgi:hypothetical protein
MISRLPPSDGKDLAAARFTAQRTNEERTKTRRCAESGGESQFPDDGLDARFGTDGLERHLHKVAGLGANAIVASLFETIEGYAGGAGQEDDLTVAVLRYRS